MKIKRFNEEASHIDDETSERFDGFVDALNDDINGMLDNLSGTLDSYTTNVSSQIKISDTITSGDGNYEYTLIIKRTA